MASTTPQRTFIVGLAFSLLLHAAAVGLLERTRTADASDDASTLVLTDIDIAPPAPEAHDPSQDQAAPPADEPGDEATAEEPEPAAEEPAATIEAVPEPVEMIADAGVPDAELAPDGGVDGATEIADLLVDAGADDAAAVAELLLDAGIEDATAIAMSGDAGGVDDATAVALAPEDGGVGDGGVAVATSSGGGDGGLAVAASSVGGDGGVAGGSGDTLGMVDGPPGDRPPGDSPPPPGASANLLTYFPAGEKIVVMIRLDRFRGTQWQPRMEAILRPMPDHQSIIGSRQISIADLFDTLIISSPQPQDVVATTLVGRFTRTSKQIRSFLDHREARVVWRSARGGALGRRQPSKLVPKHDRRVFLVPEQGMILLVNPKHLGKLTDERKVAIDSARSSEADRPEWIKRVATIEKESGEEDGPALLLTMQGFPKQVEIPLVAVLPGPDRATLSFEITKQGFVVRGNLLFDTEQRAAEFVKVATETQQSLLSSYKGRLFLAPFHAFNALKGLSLKRKGEKVAYATSISIADGQAMLDYGAKWAELYFQSGATMVPPAGGENTE